MTCAHCREEFESSSNDYEQLCPRCDQAELDAYRTVERTPLYRVPSRYSKSVMKERLGVNHESEL